MYSVASGGSFKRFELQIFASLPDYWIYGIVGAILGASLAALGWLLERRGLKQGRYTVLLAFVITQPLVKNYILPSLDEPRIVAFLSQGLPKRVDDYTIWERVTLSDGHLTYHYRLQGLSADDVDPAAFKQTWLPTLCENFRTDFSDGRYDSVEYRYDIQGSIESFIITPKDC